MIKSEVSVAKPKEPTFPALYKCGDTVILATSEGSVYRNELVGTVVSSETFQMGSFDRTWNADEFERFDGSVTLKNAD